MPPILLFSSAYRISSARRCRRPLNAAFLFLCLLLAGCTLGPKQLQGNRISYNVSIQSSNNEELLLNLVRLRYMEVPCFMQVSSVTSSFEYSLSLQTQAQLSKGDFYDQFPMRWISPLVKGGYSENPTISYSPLAGEKFVSQLLTDVTPQRFSFLDRAGWEINLLFQLLVKEIGPLRNPDPRQLSGPQIQEVNRRFNEFVEKLREIQLRNDLALLYPESKKQVPYDLVMQFRFKNTSEARSIESLLGTKLKLKTLPEGSIFGQIFLSEKLGLQPPKDLQLEGPILRVSFRNFVGVLVHLLDGVETPPEEADKGIVEGKIPASMDMGVEVGKIIVHCATSSPKAPFIAIQYRGKYFFIADEDFSSKRTFAFIATLLALQSGDVKATTPVLTLPVGVSPGR